VGGVARDRLQRFRNLADELVLGWHRKRLADLLKAQMIFAVRDDEPIGDTVALGQNWRMDYEKCVVWAAARARMRRIFHHERCFVNPGLLRQPGRAGGRREGQRQAAKTREAKAIAGSRTLLEQNLVEAAGIEPASRSTLRPVLHV